LTTAALFGLDTYLLGNNITEASEENSWTLDALLGLPTPRKSSGGPTGGGGGTSKRKSGGSQKKKQTQAKTGDNQKAAAAGQSQQQQQQTQAHNFRHLGFGQQQAQRGGVGASGGAGQRVGQSPAATKPATAATRTAAPVPHQRQRFFFIKNFFLILLYY
jgi:hypothetical protein